MGLNRSSVAFLATALRLGASYEATLQLGRQWLADDLPLANALREGGVDRPANTVERDGYADGLLRLLGAELVDSLDASGWEGATIIHDLNEPLPARLRRRYSAVLDGGTLEHIFEFPTALRSALDAVRQDGHFVCITPSNNLSGHGFYQFSPELYFSFLPAAGFQIDIALIRGNHPGARWYRMSHPQQLRRRVDLTGVLFPQLLYLSARRVSVLDLDQIVPQQSDYVAAWANGSATRRLSGVRELIPRRWRTPARDVRNLAWSASRFPAAARDFQPVRLTDLVG